MLLRTHTEGAPGPSHLGTGDRKLKFHWRVAHPKFFRNLTILHGGCPIHPRSLRMGGNHEFQSTVLYQGTTGRSCAVHPRSLFWNPGNHNISPRHFADNYPPPAYSYFMNKDHSAGTFCSLLPVPLIPVPLTTPPTPPTPPFFIFKTLQVIKRTTGNVIAFRDWNRRLSGYSNPENLQAIIHSCYHRKPESWLFPLPVSRIAICTFTSCATPMPG
jgi:hypothetical protein